MTVLEFVAISISALGRLTTTILEPDEINEKAVEHAVIGSTLDKIMACNDVQAPMVIMANKINDWAMQNIKFALAS